MRARCASTSSTGEVVLLRICSAICKAEREVSSDMGWHSRKLASLTCEIRLTQFLLDIRRNARAELKRFNYAKQLLPDWSTYEKSKSSAYGTRPDWYR